MTLQRSTWKDNHTKNIGSFISKNLENHGDDAIPEIAALRQIIENNPWHKNQSVFDHTKAVVESLRKYTKNELLLLAALFHDISKPMTLVHEKNLGMTTCMGHEAKGSIMMDEIGPRIGLTGEELMYVKYIIEHHDAPHILLNNVMERNDAKMSEEKYFDMTGKYARELLLHALADMEGSDLSQINPDVFEKRKKVIEMLMKTC